jgi:YVTN family beta-propeller protein
MGDGSTVITTPITYPMRGSLGYSPDHRTLAVVSIGSNSVTFIDTTTNAVKHVTYVGRSPHEAFFTPDGREVWVTVRGENYISVLDAKTFMEKTRIITPSGPGMQIFSPDGKYGYICSSFNPETDVVSLAGSQDHREGQAGKPVLPEHRGDTGRKPGLVHTEGHRQDAGVQRSPAIQPDQDNRHGPDHQPRQLRPYGKGNVRLCHCWRPKRSQGVPHRRFLGGRHHPGR